MPVLLVLGATLVLPIKWTWLLLLKLEWQGPKTVLPGCAIHWAHVRPDLWKKAGTATITSLGRLPATKRLCSAKQWIHFRLGPHLPCTSSFACLGSHPSLGGHCWIGSHQVGVGFGSLRFSDCWFDISWPLASFSRSTTALILQS